MVSFVEPSFLRIHLKFLHVLCFFGRKNAEIALQKPGSHRISSKHTIQRKHSPSPRGKPRIGDPRHLVKHFSCTLSFAGEAASAGTCPRWQRIAPCGPPASGCRVSLPAWQPFPAERECRHCRRCRPGSGTVPPTLGGHGSILGSSPSRGGTPSVLHAQSGKPPGASGVSHLLLDIP